MKQLNVYIIALLATLLLGCRSTQTAQTADPTHVPAWRQVQPGNTRQQVYDALGAPQRETKGEAVWKSPEATSGCPSTITWRMLYVYFDENGQVTETRIFQRQN